MVKNFKNQWAMFRMRKCYQAPFPIFGRGLGTRLNVTRMGNDTRYMYFPAFSYCKRQKAGLKGNCSVGREMVSDHYSLALAKSVLQFGAFIGTMHI